MNYNDIISSIIAEENLDKVITALNEILHTKAIGMIGSMYPGQLTLSDLDEEHIEEQQWEFLGTAPGNDQYKLYRHLNDLYQHTVTDQHGEIHHKFRGSTPDVKRFLKDYEFESLPRDNINESVTDHYFEHLQDNLDDIKNGKATTDSLVNTGYLPSGNRIDQHNIDFSEQDPQNFQEFHHNLVNNGYKAHGDRYTKPTKYGNSELIVHTKKDNPNLVDRVQVTHISDPEKIEKENN